MGYAALLGFTAQHLSRRQATDSDPDEDTDAGQKEIYSSWALLILILLLIIAFFTSYVLQSKKIQAVHETVISIFAGMVIGLILRLTAVTSVLDAVSFDYQFFFNLLLPPIILASGYELHQGNFFRNIGTILTFAFAGTFISALVLAAILWLWTRIPLEGLDITFVEALSVGATLSATDPVTILAIFNTYKVDPKLYTCIFGESILNDAIAIVLFETAQKYREGATAGKLTVLSLFESIGVFLLVFTGSVMIGVVIGLLTSLLLKLTHVRREPKIESCVIILIAYASYFFANAIHMSGIVSLLFCGICMKHYAYHNMSRRTQLTTKFTFGIMAQLSENFIFIYLGLSLFTEPGLEYKPLFILITVIGICVARWCAVFPLSSAINWFIRYRARRRGMEVAEEIPGNWKIMIFWAGLRGAVGVALAAGLVGPNGFALRATVLVVVVLTVIIFGGTTARMLEILNIRTGVVEEIDSDDEFDIEPVPQHSGAYTRKNGSAFGHTPKSSLAGNGGIGLGYVNGKQARRKTGDSSYSTGNVNGSPTVQPEFGRRNSSKANLGKGQHDAQNAAEQGLLDPDEFSNVDAEDEEDLDLPPAARRSPRRPSPANPSEVDTNNPYPVSGSRTSESQQGMTARGAFSQILNVTSEDAGNLFNRIDEGFLKPHLLLDPGGGHGHGHGHGNHGQRHWDNSGGGGGGAGSSNGGGS
ncbi:sodium/hydrogen exchanger [Hortaea werneckii]|uniref:Sodium/hydrogen exchanger n=1 Tax=Hortaea werneckii TaxID=91943 RepID=A0A3M7F809_HORWE|nr:sodium/hydrogen exchanger [Hortaea werneckii]KAI6889039.1 sodium/hydrogen exchanger [Hortaea werneckii]KAI7000746.1 sodium/hydrogen exchanger [Hortaea werneckii]KAI7087641.1 sodium/hydrogen exchanger [Hortaea werneckii]KAI7148583.1 sodium/hydrogen exchanger [Hortaea werneckii]